MKTSYDFPQGKKNPYPKRIIVSVKIENALDIAKSFRCDAFVDTHVSLMVLPTAWKDGLGRLESTGIIELSTTRYGRIRGEVRGPVRIQIEGFRPINTEVVFVKEEPEVREFKPLLGHMFWLKAKQGLTCSVIVSFQSSIWI